MTSHGGSPLVRNDGATLLQPEGKDCLFYLIKTGDANHRVSKTSI